MFKNNMLLFSRSVPQGGGGGASVTSRSHDDLLSWATLSRVNFIAPGQVHRHLITTNLSEFL